MKLFFNKRRARQRGRHRKHRRGWWAHFREYVYPSMGVRSFLRFFEIRIKRSAGSPSYVALGFALGIFVSCSPFVGFHTIITLILCYFFRASYIAGVLATFMGNPWTLPFVWMATIGIGNWVLGNDASALMPTDISLSEFLSNTDFYVYNLGLPMLIGGIPVGLVLATAIYFLIKHQIVHYRKTRAAFLRAKRRERVMQTLRLPFSMGSKMMEAGRKAASKMTQPKKERSE